LSGAVELWVNTTGEQEVDFGDYGEVDYLTTSNTFALRGTDLQFAIDGFASVSGDLVIVIEEEADERTVLVTAEGVTASLSAGPASIAITEAAFALALFSDGEDTSYALYAEGSADLTGVPGIGLSGNLTAWVNTTGSAEITFGDFGTIDYGSEDELFAFSGEDVELSVANFVTLSGAIA
ncbi:hypothetical protein, partial [Limnospira sp. PMC 1306.21]